MKSVIILCGIVGLSIAQLDSREDDGSYNPAKYEDPYKYTEYQDDQQQYQAYPQYQQQPQVHNQPIYQPTAYQHIVKDHKHAAILNEARYLNGDGQFGSSYTQDDGVQFKEETSADGSRKGSYTYIAPDGHRKTVTYTAGKNGFQASGDHLPVGHTPIAAPAYQQPQPQAYELQSSSLHNRNSQFAYNS